MTEMNDKMYVSVSLESYRSGFLLLDGIGLEIHYTDKIVLHLVLDSIWTIISMFRFFLVHSNTKTYYGIFETKRVFQMPINIILKRFRKLKNHKSSKLF